MTQRGRPPKQPKTSTELAIIDTPITPTIEEGLYPGLDRKVGDEVYFLHKDGFVKGLIKRISYMDDLIFSQKQGGPVRETTLCIRVVTNIHDTSNGEAIENHLLFGSYEDMFEYYSKIKM